MNQRLIKCRFLIVAKRTYDDDTVSHNLQYLTRLLLTQCLTRPGITATLLVPGVIETKHEFVKWPWQLFANTHTLESLPSSPHQAGCWNQTNAIWGRILLRWSAVHDSRVCGENLRGTNGPCYFSCESAIWYQLVGWNQKQWVEWVYTFSFLLVLTSTNI